jgi:hypothetical protein
MVKGRDKIRRITVDDDVAGKFCDETLMGLLDAGATG